MYDKSSTASSDQIPTVQPQQPHCTFLPNVWGQEVVPPAADWMKPPQTGPPSRLKQELHVSATRPTTDWVNEPTNERTNKSLRPVLLTTFTAAGVARPSNRFLPRPHLLFFRRLRILSLLLFPRPFVPVRSGTPLDALHCPAVSSGGSSRGGRYAVQRTSYQHVWPE